MFDIDKKKVSQNPIQISIQKPVQTVSQGPKEEEVPFERPKISNTNFDMMLDRKINERKNAPEEKIQAEMVETRDLGELKNLELEEGLKERISRDKGSKPSSNEPNRNSYLSQF